MKRLTHIRRSTLAVQAARELERMIVTGEWTEGTKIPAEPQLVEQLGVSRNTVREAVRALTHQGLLEARPGDGTYVLSTDILGASLSRRLAHCELREVLEARLCLEREAARLAALRREPKDVEVLRTGLAHIQKVFEAGDPVADVVQAVFDHNLDIVRAGRNRLLLELYSNIAGSVRASIEALLGTIDRRQLDTGPARELHEELIEAIDAGDGEAAVRLMTELNLLLQQWLGEEEDEIHDENG